MSIEMIAYDPVQGQVYWLTLHEGFSNPTEFRIALHDQKSAMRLDTGRARRVPIITPLTTSPVRKDHQEVATSSLLF